VKIVVFDEAARRISPGTSSMRGSRLEEGWHDRERQRHDQDPRLRPTKPEYSGSVVGETAATGSSGTTMLNSSGRHPRGHLRSLPKLEVRRQAKLHSIMPPAKVSAGWGAMEARFTGQSWWRG
jgi:hypothetical protein